MNIFFINNIQLFMLSLPTEIWQYRITRYFDGYTLTMWRATCQFARNNSVTILNYLYKVYKHKYSFDFLPHENVKFVIYVFSNYMIKCSFHAIEMACRFHNDDILNTISNNHNLYLEKNDNTHVKFAILGVLSKLHLEIPLEYQIDRYKLLRSILGTIQNNKLPSDVFGNEYREHDDTIKLIQNYNTHLGGIKKFSIIRCLIQNNLQLLQSVNLYDSMLHCMIDLFLTKPNEALIYFIQNTNFITADIPCYYRYLLMDDEKFINVLLNKISEVADDHEKIYCVLLHNVNKKYARDFAIKHSININDISQDKINILNPFYQLSE